MSRGLTVTAPEGSPYVDCIREFEAPAAAVFAAHADPDLYRQWLGPRRLTTRIDGFDFRPGGTWRFVQSGDDGVEHGFHGVFHSIRHNEFILQTFEYEGFPDLVSLEQLTLENLEGGRCRLTGRSVYPSLEGRAKYLDGGMESGMSDGYERLDELLVSFRSRA